MRYTSHFCPPDPGGGPEFRPQRPGERLRCPHRRCRYGGPPGRSHCGQYHPAGDWPCKCSLWRQCGTDGWSATAWAKLKIAFPDGQARHRWHRLRGHVRQRYYLLRGRQASVLPGLHRLRKECAGAHRVHREGRLRRLRTVRRCPHWRRDSRNARLLSRGRGTTWPVTHRRGGQARSSTTRPCGPGMWSSPFRPPAFILTASLWCGRCSTWSIRTCISPWKPWAALLWGGPADPTKIDVNPFWRC